MSVIWGLWRRDGNPATASDLSRMAARVGGFARDTLDLWSESAVGMGRGLAMTLPEDSFDRQPILLSGGSVLVADLRLDNRADLAGAMAILPSDARVMSDAHLLAAAWERWGEDCLARLVGPFAFAVWEETARRLFCARDHLARRPLYYCVRGPLFAFSSLPRVLAALPEVPWAVDETRIATSLAFLPDPGARSYFDGIAKLPAAHWLSVTPAAESIRRYWQLDLHRRIHLPSDDAYCEAFRDVFQRAVECRLRARAPVGAMLSGGFDSGSVTATAACLLARQGRPLTAFTAVPAQDFEGPVENDRIANEAGHAASIAALYPNVRHVLVPPLPLCPLEFVSRPYFWVDSPGSHFGMLPNWGAMAEAQRSAGVGVVLTGLSGNMTISYRGWSLVPQLLRQGRWRRWYREASGLVALSHFGWLGVLALSFGPFLPPWLWRLLQRDSAVPFSRVRQYALLHPRFFQNGEIERLAAAAGWDLSYRPRADGPRGRLANLLRFDRGAGGAAGLAYSGVDYRDPTIDRRLVEFCLAVPEDQYLRLGRTRFLLRRAMDGRLSPLVLDEWRRGLCGADWHLRVAPYQARFAAAVEQIAALPAASRCLNLDRMRYLTAHWPSDWSRPSVRLEHGMGLCRAVQAGSFIRWVSEGT